MYPFRSYILYSVQHPSPTSNAAGAAGAALIYLQVYMTRHKLEAACRAQINMLGNYRLKQALRHEPHLCRKWIIDEAAALQVEVNSPHL
jgi:hypothetical protein